MADRVDITSVYQVDITAKRLVSGIEDLKNEFPKDSPIPGYVYYELVDDSKVYLKNANFDIRLINEVGTPEGHIPDIKPGFFGQKKQTVFLTKTGEKNFIHPFLDINIATILTRLCPKKFFNDVERIVIVTKYIWRLSPVGNIFDQDRSVLVFDLLPEHRIALEQEMLKF